MHSTSVPQPSQHPSVWKGPQIQAQDSWIFRLDQNDNDELDAALWTSRRTGRPVLQLRAEDFPLPTLGPRLKALQHELVHGRGFGLVRGFDMGRHPVTDAASIYWGLGAHLGHHGAQNAQGDLLGHVTDLGLDYRTNTNARGYQTRQRLPFHNDALDVVGLLCVQTAMSGGRSRIVSATTVHNEILERRPDLLAVLYEDFFLDRRGEQPPGKSPFHSGPMFSWFDGRLFCQYNRGYIQSAQRFEQVPRLGPVQIEALDLMDQLTNDPALVLEMDLQPGEMQFLCNYTVLHSRTDYQDWPEKERRRYLLRLWLETGLVPRLPPHLEDRWGDVKLWQANPQPPIFDLSVRRQELAH